MSRHEGVSCDLCMKNNFTDMRFKCLRCNDFDLCSPCFTLSTSSSSFSSSSSRHSPDHPMQCILTKADINILHGGEVNSHPSSYCCPFCGLFGFSIATLTTHVNTDHNPGEDDRSHCVLCPICETSPDGDPGLIVDDMASHLSMHAHTSEEATDSKQLRRPNQSLARTTTNQSAYSPSTPASNSSGARNFVRGSLLHLIDPAIPLSSMAGDIRDVMDPITELLSHLNSVRRLASTNQSSSNQMQQIESQLANGRQQQKEQQQQAVIQSVSAGGGAKDDPSNNNSTSKPDGKFLLVKLLKEHQREPSQHSTSEEERLLRCHFIHELLLSNHPSTPSSPLSHSHHDTSTSFTKLPMSSSISSSLSSSSLIYHPFDVATSNCAADDHSVHDHSDSGVTNVGEVAHYDDEDEGDEDYNGDDDSIGVSNYLMSDFASGDLHRQSNPLPSSSLAHLESERGQGYNLDTHPNLGRIPPIKKRCKGLRGMGSGGQK